MIAVLRSQFFLRKPPDRHLFTAGYLIVDRQECTRVLASLFIAIAALSLIAF